MSEAETTRLVSSDHFTFCKKWYTAYNSNFVEQKEKFENINLDTQQRANQGVGQENFNKSLPKKGCQICHTLLSWLRFGVYIVCFDVFFQIKKEFFEFIQFLDFQLHFCVFIFQQKSVWFVLTRLLLIVGMSNCTLVFCFEKFKEFPIQQKKIHQNWLPY